MGLRMFLLYAVFSVNYFFISAEYCVNPYDLRCASDQVCCNNQCVYGTQCYGYYCSSDSDCTLGESCCDNTCTDSDYCSTNVGVIIGAVFSILFGIFLICVIFVCCRRRRRALGTVQRPILGRRVITRTTTTTTTRPNYRPVANYPQQGPYQGQQPYGYQQGYAQPPPPQYPGYGATNAYGAYQNAGQNGSNVQPPAPTTQTAQPPPYEEVPAVVAMGKGNTDQKNNYQQASAPPM